MAVDLKFLINIKYGFEVFHFTNKSHPIKTYQYLQELI